MNCDLLATILQKGFPGVGFAISEAYEGETAYDKLSMATGYDKPSLEDIEAAGKSLGLL